MSGPRVKVFEMSEQLVKSYVFIYFSEEKKGGANENVPNFTVS